MAELALDDHEGHTLTSHFDGVRVPQRMWSEPAADSRCDGVRRSSAIKQQF